MGYTNPILPADISTEVTALAMSPSALIGDASRDQNFFIAISGETLAKMISGSS